MAIFGGKGITCTDNGTAGVGSIIINRGCGMNPMWSLIRKSRAKQRKMRVRTDNGDKKLKGRMVIQTKGGLK